MVGAYWIPAFQPSPKRSRFGFAQAGAGMTHAGGAASRPYCSSQVTRMRVSTVAVPPSIGTSFDISMRAALGRP